MDAEEEASNTRLCLGIGTGAGDLGGSKQKPAAQLHVLFPTHSKRNIGKEDDGSSSKVNDEGDDHDADNDEHGNCNARKKLMLSKEQLGMLEAVFKERMTITQKEKQELAKKVNLQPRQVEVWFQNRRARIKSKQVGMNCEFFKKCCENLRTENLRLKNELQELKSTAREKVHEICPSCQRLALMEEGKMEKESFGAMEGSSMTSEQALLI